MAKFRKKPVVIEAYEFLSSDKSQWPEWLQKAHEVATVRRMADANGLEYITIQTLEGMMVANKGDYIIQGIKGEIYPCKPDIFTASYDPAE